MTEICPVTGKPVLPCPCGPHLQCPEHLLNCLLGEEPTEAESRAANHRSGCTRAIVLGLLEVAAAVRELAGARATARPFRGEEPAP